MKKSSRKYIGNLAPLVSLLALEGCSGLPQHFSAVKEAPIAEQYRLKEKLSGRVAVVVSESSGDKYRKAAAEALTRVLEEYREKRSNGLEILSSADVSNIMVLNGKDERYKKFLKECDSTLFSEDLKFIREVTGADYVLQPVLLGFEQGSKKRFDLPFVGVRFLETNIVSVKTSLYVYDKKGIAVYGASSQFDMAEENFVQKGIPFDKAFRMAFAGLVNKLPKQ